MEETTWENGKLIGTIGAVLASLKWLVGRSRVATVDEKYATLSREVKQQIEELERKMNDQVYEIRREMAQTQGKIQRVEDEQHEQRLKVMRALDEMQANWQSGFRAMKAALGIVEMPPSRQV